jgi:beta-barrel assembly-enhancing protease
MLLQGRVPASMIFTVLFASSMWSEHGCKNQESALSGWIDAPGELGRYGGRMKYNVKWMRAEIGFCLTLSVLFLFSSPSWGQDDQAVDLVEVLTWQPALPAGQVMARPAGDYEALFKTNITQPAISVAKKPSKKAKKYDIDRIGDRGIGKGINFYSVSQEQELGRELSLEIEMESKLITDPAVNSYIQRLCQSLVSHSDTTIPFTIKVLDSDTINAFALPGGYFYINSGLILAADNEAELAAVMAHEIAHVAARHATKNMTKSQIWGFASLALTAVGGPAGVIIHQVADIAVPMTFLKFGRNEEREADLLGLEYQYAAGYDPLAFVNFFERIAVHQKKDGNFVSRLFASHPMTTERIRRAQEEIGTMLPPREQYVVSTNEFDEVKARVASATVGIKSLANLDLSKPTLRRGGKTEPDPDSTTDPDRPTLRRR